MRAALLLAALLVGIAACAPMSAQRQSTALLNVQVLAERLSMPGLNRVRTLRLYLPPSYATHPDRRYPVIYMHDGQNLFDDATSYAGEWGVDETLNELATRTGFEAIVVGIDHGVDKRGNELIPWAHPRLGAAEGDAYLDFIVGVVKPYVDSRYRTRAEAASTALIGSSIGGVISHYAMHRHPAVFGKAGVFSPAYWVAPQMEALARERPLPATARVYFYAGGRESDEMVPDAERMQALLPRQGAASRLHVVPEGRHDEAAWRAEFARAVAWLFEL
jgi:predicted alpha/beta superfamily hydrolase